MTLALVAFFAFLSGACYTAALAVNFLSIRSPNPMYLTSVGLAVCAACVPLVFQA